MAFIPALATVHLYFIVGVNAVLVVVLVVVVGGCSYH